MNHLPRHFGRDLRNPLRMGLGKQIRDQPLKLNSSCASGTRRRCACRAPRPRTKYDLLTEVLNCIQEYKQKLSRRLQVLGLDWSWALSRNSGVALADACSTTSSATLAESCRRDCLETCFKGQGLECRD